MKPVSNSNQPLQITIITLFPNVIHEYISTSMLGRAAKQGLVEYKIVDLRPFGEGVHQIVDGRPFGGGAGMVLRADILAKAIKSILPEKGDKPHVIFTSPAGTPYTQQRARELSKIKEIIIICGHYESVDQRFIDHYVDEEISVGDYVLTGGELPALTITDSIVRLIPGVLKKEDATVDESFTENLLEYPHYTRPAEFEGERVPDVLISGNHQEVAKWKREQAIKKTEEVRPDLLKRVTLPQGDE